MEQYDLVKEQGSHHYLAKDKNKGKNYHTRYGRSLNYKYQSQNKKVRKIADRHSHHRRRNHNRNEESKGTLDSDTVCPSSSNVSQKCGKSLYGSAKSQQISNRKRMI